MKPDPLDAYVDLIAEAFHQGNARFFIGAGIPKADLDMPLFGELAARILNTVGRKQPELAWCQELVNTDKKSGKLKLVNGLLPEQVAEFCKIVEPQLLDREILAALSGFNPSGSCYSGLMALANYAPSALDIIYTTNFDTTLETLFGSRGTSISTIRHWKLRTEDPTGIGIVHLHGIAREGNVTIGESDLYGAGVEFNPLYEAVLHDLAHKTLIFVGYGLEDPGIKLLFSMAGKLYETTNLKHYAIYPMKYLGKPRKQYEARGKLLATLWNKRGVTLIDVEPGWFFESLSKRIQTLSFRAEIKRIAQRRTDLTETDIESIVVRVANAFALPKVENAMNFVRFLL